MTTSEDAISGSAGLRGWVISAREWLGRSLRLSPRALR
jgi:hypothetical protein